MYLSTTRPIDRHRLLVNFHGGTIPRGTERTWPHVMMFEAVRGAEGIKPRPGLPDDLVGIQTLRARTSRGRVRV